MTICHKFHYHSSQLPAGTLYSQSRKPSITNDFKDWQFSYGQQPLLLTLTLGTKAMKLEHPDPPSGDNDKPPSFRDVAPAIEFSCWVVVALAPLLRWVNGAAVTDDQFVIQVALVVLALTCALGLRIYNWRKGRKRRMAISPQSQRE